MKIIAFLKKNMNKLLMITILVLVVLIFRKIVKEGLDSDGGDIVSDLPPKNFPSFLSEKDFIVPGKGPQDSDGGDIVSDDDIGAGGKENINLSDRGSPLPSLSELENNAKKPNERYLQDGYEWCWENMINMW